ncbi:hypothetical protein L1987_05914 [Smallanthus sonchifolius]|uniref:Uncharacterized protein n=1 Tax=Smallanthus sonchifolius TaxID=185202 RepID=A0ACB9JWQ6_9ASTR|nr:hypothetical protein L1987_05914 [Smallanthus sonchifolius]
MVVHSCTDRTYYNSYSLLYCNRIMAEQPKSKNKRPRKRVNNAPPIPELEPIPQESAAEGDLEPELYIPLHNHRWLHFIMGSKWLHFIMGRLFADEDLREDDYQLGWSFLTKSTLENSRTECGTVGGGERITYIVERVGCSPRTLRTLSYSRVRLYRTRSRMFSHWPLIRTLWLPRTGLCSLHYLLIHSTSNLRQLD